MTFDAVNGLNGTYPVLYLPTLQLFVEDLLRFDRLVNTQLVGSSNNRHHRLVEEG